ncbi:MAG: phosphodiesterase [Desulfuromonadales bacterium]|nr:phosphodiesterase [Desulfuromonadales bacterium]
MIIAQISDLHITAQGRPAYGVADTVSALERTVHHLNRLDPAPDVVLVSGDITDDGSLDGYIMTQSILAGLHAPVFLIPGNHDDKNALIQGFPEHEYLQTCLDVDRDAGICYSLDGIRFGLPLEIIAIDSTFQGKHGGGMDSARLAWLDARLVSAPDRPAMIFMHHPPFPSGISHMDHEPFVNRQLLADILRRHPRILGLSCGHIHRAIFTRFGGVKTSVCPGIGMQLVLDLAAEAPSAFIMEPPAVMLHCLRKDWDGALQLLTHVSLVAEADTYGSSYLFSS